MLESQRRITHPVTDLKPVASAADVVSFQEEVTRVHVDPQVRNYLLSLIAATREDNSLRAGISPRGSLALYRASQALASLRGRDFVSPTDIKEMAPPVFRQRLLLSSEALVRGIQPDRIITSILDSVPMPEYRATL
jgi:MoxR-like ATPase